MVGPVEPRMYDAFPAKVRQVFLNCSQKVFSSFSS